MFYYNRLLPEVAELTDINDYSKIPELTLVMVEKSQRMFGFLKYLNYDVPFK